MHAMPNFSLSSFGSSLNDNNFSVFSYKNSVANAKKKIKTHVKTVRFALECIAEDVFCFYRSFNSEKYNIRTRNKQ